MALGKRKRRTQKFVPPKLMLTSMMDMFTIILIFLLFSFSETPETLRLDKNLELPHSSAEAGYKKAIQIVLSKNELRLDDEVMAEVRGHRILGLTPDDPGSSTLCQRLKSRRAEQKAEAPEDATDQAPHILFLCDKSHSFKTINSVIKAAGMAGYPNFQFAVLEEK
jgi:biopolymer transport protein ExbD